jgi:beta-galactosidase
MNILKFISFTLLSIFVYSFTEGLASAAPGRYEKDISDLEWRLWLDKDAEWKNDTLHLPPIDLSKLPVNAPTSGWESLEKGMGKSVRVPATVEEHFWHENGNDYGVAGNYVGVSWFVTSFDLPQDLAKKRILLDFESVRLRAEIYVNRKLAGYDLITGTPFQVDITPFVKLGERNQLAVRITDPNGNFDWRDVQTYRWGKYLTPPSHGFGGITGRVKLVATDPTYIEDIFVKNKPAMHEIDVEINLTGSTSVKLNGELSISILDKQGGHSLLEKRVNVTSTSSSYSTRQTFQLPQAELWSPERPNLYLLQVDWKSKDGANDKQSRRFGFRWFEIRDINGDRQFYLNGKRIVLRSAISWGFWPVNGIYPTEELAEKQIRAAKTVGLNMLNFHRAIGQTIVLNKADELGLLYYAEPGGYNTNPTDPFIEQWSREKLLRMIRRDRSHPSLVIYNMGNERNRDPGPVQIKDMRDAHQLDETRVITHTSTNFPRTLYGGKAPTTPAPIKMFMEPYKHEQFIQGWWDEHHAGGPGVYSDEMYQNPKSYWRYTNHAGEIIFFGEEGAIGAPHRLQLVREELNKTNQLGWDGNSYVNQFQAFDRFLTEKGFREAFPTVDDLTKGLGNVALYYQGRIIENIRMNNIVDGYVVNGWEGEKIENHSGIVDIYRNIKGDPSLIADYNKPLFVAVKVKDKVIQSGESSDLSLFIVNEVDLKGDFKLQLRAVNQNKTVMEQSFPVTVTGGHQYGQLLVEKVSIPSLPEGYTDVLAELKRGEETVATGKDQILAVKLDSQGISNNGMILDKTGDLKKLIASFGGPTLPDYQSGRPDGKYLIVGETTEIPGTENNHVNQPLLDWVMEGNTIVIVKGMDKWGDVLLQKEVVDYRGFFKLGRNWYGGNFFVKNHPLFDGLPVDRVFNWEYQAFSRYMAERYGLRLNGTEVVVGAVADHKPEVFSAVGIIPLGRGRIVYSTLDLFYAWKNERRSSVVAKRLLQNYLRYAVSGSTSEKKQ